MINLYMRTNKELVFLCSCHNMATATYIAKAIGEEVIYEYPKIKSFPTPLWDSDYGNGYGRTEWSQDHSISG